MRVGVIGGGQLAWMMADAAKQLDIQLIVQTPSLNDPAVAIASDVVLAQVGDASATAELAQKCDVITFENEFVNLPALSQINTRFYPRLASLMPLLDKFDQRSFLQEIGVPTPGFAAIADVTPERLGQFGLPAVLKARRHGYDGQGTFIFKDFRNLSRLPASASANQWLIEEFVPFTAELAVMAARSAAGEVVIYPTVETQQVEQICRRVYVTDQFDAAVTAQVETIASKILTALDYVGILGIEFFLNADRQVLVNELAPRTHNSGHYSLDACVTSQFEQQLRAVCGLSLGSAALTSTGAVMVNLLGYETSDSDYTDKRQRLSQLPNAHVYWYNKTSRPGRKLGHVTVLLPFGLRAEAVTIAESIEQIWYPASA
jgi:5-(carboxyamino)imidazole ribonucleotide synthase